MAIISTIDHIRKHTDVTISININSALPLLPQVARQYILPLVPTLLYNRLDAIVESSLDPLGVDLKLLLKLRETVANLVVAAYVARGSVSLSASGLRRIEGANEKTAYKNQETNFIHSYQLAGLSALDEFLQLCTENAATIPEWKDSQRAARFAALLIKDGQELNDYITLKHPQITYRQLLADMEDVERILFAPKWGANYATLKARANNLASLTASEKDLLGSLKRCLAYSAMSRAVPHLALSVESEGIMSVSVDGDSGKTGLKAAPNQIELLANNWTATAGEYLDLSLSAFDKVLAEDVASPSPVYVTVIKSNASPLADNSQNQTSFLL